MDVLIIVFVLWAVFNGISRSARQKRGSGKKSAREFSPERTRARAAAVEEQRRRMEAYENEQAVAGQASQQRNIEDMRLAAERLKAHEAEQARRRKAEEELLAEQARQRQAAQIGRMQTSPRSAKPQPAPTRSEDDLPPYRRGQTKQAAKVAKPALHQSAQSMPQKAEATEAAITQPSMKQQGSIMQRLTAEPGIEAASFIPATGLNRDDLIRGVIMAEVLGPPRGRRRRLETRR